MECGNQFFLRMALQPERHLMGYVLHSISAEWEQNQQYQLLETGERQYRVLSRHNGEVLQPFFREVVEVYESTSIWNQLAETEQFRTRLLQTVMSFLTECSRCYLPTIIWHRWPKAS